MYRSLSIACALLATVAVAGLAGCTNSTGITEQQIACPTDSTLTYASFGQQVISDNCLSCHESRERPRLSTQAEVQANANSIIDEAVFSSSMPQDSNMADDVRIQLGQWLRCGAP
ncbi:MAG TPA: hypothetical protein VHE35_27830 [Kofleriaceae bacterium]|nr:hypothetical protein [Kofleriaceae bacterium]